MNDNAPKQVTPEMLVAMFAGALRVTTHGLCSLNHMIPGNIMWDCIAQAMGVVLSEATKTPDVAQTIQVRNRVAKLVEENLKKHVPAMDMEELTIKAKAS